MLLYCIILGKKLWVVFPDNKEANLAKLDPTWGSNPSFTISSIDSLLSIKEYNIPEDALPSLIVAVNPG